MTRKKRPASVAGFLEKSGSFAAPPKGKGRPTVDSLPFPDALRHASVKTARKVWTLFHEMGGKRGDFARACEAVAREQAPKPLTPHELTQKADTPKHHAHRHKAHAEPLARLSVANRQAQPDLTSLLACLDEIDHRTRAFAEDARDYLYTNLTPRALLAFLQTHQIDGTCPPELAAEIRADLLSLNR